MKKTVQILLLAILISGAAVAQECGAFLPMTAGKTYVYFITTGAGKRPTGKYEYKVVSADAGVAGYKGTFTVQQVRQSGKNFEKPCTYYVLCGAQGTTVKADSTDFPAMSFGNLYLPADVKVGLEFPDNLQAYYYDKRNKNKKTGGLALFHQKITGKEHITTALGTFEAFVLEYDRVAKQGSMLLTANLLGAVKIHNKEWYVAGTGMIKRESYLGKKLVTTVELSNQ